MPAPVTIENRPFWARILTAFWLLEIVFGAFVVATGVSWLGGAENGAGVVLILGGLLVIGAGLVMSEVSWRVARLKGAAIELTDEGFRDRRLSDTLIKWRDLDWRVVFNGKSWSLQFDLPPKLRETYRVSWGNRMMGALNRTFKYPEFTIVTLGTGKNPQEIAEMMKGFKSGRS